MKSNTTLAAALSAGALMLASAGTSAVEMELGKARLSFYGELDVWAGRVESKLPGQDSSLKLDSGGMNTSFAGFSGNMPLTEGLAAVAALEMFLRPDSAQEGRYDGDRFFARSAYVGVEGRYGRLTAGRNTSPYYLPVVFSNAFAGSFVFSPSILHSFQDGNFGPIAGDSGWSNSIAYYSPSYEGLRGSLVYGFGENAGESGENKIGFNLFYNRNAFELTLAGYRFNLEDGSTGYMTDEQGPLSDDYFLNFDLGLGAVETQQALLLGGSYDFGVARVFGQYQTLDTELTNGDATADTYTAGVRVPTRSGAIKLAYAFSDFGDDMDDERTTATLGYDHYFGNNFDLYAAVMHDEIKSLESGLTYGVGARFRW